MYERSGSAGIPGAHEVELKAAEQAFERVRPQLEALAEKELVGVRIDLQLAGALAHRIAIRDAKPDRRSQFARLDKVDLYDVSQIDRLADLGLTAWHVRRRQLGKEAIASNANVPEAVIKDAQIRRARMLRVVAVDAVLAAFGRTAGRAECFGLERGDDTERRASIVATATRAVTLERATWARCTDLRTHSGSASRTG